jgi:hypothetical protein
MRQGAIKIHGEGPRGSSVEVVDADGVVIGKTVADDRGLWQLNESALELGEHTIRAFCTRADGEVIESSPLPLTVEAGADAGDDLECTLTPEEIEELAFFRVEHKRESEQARAQAEEMYVEMVEAVCEGFEIDELTGENILALCEKSVEDFSRDVGQLGLVRSQRRLHEATWRAVLDSYSPGEHL